MAFQLIIHTKIWVIVMLGHSLHLIKTFLNNWASLVVQRLKRLPAMWETWVLSLGREDPLEKEIWQPTPVLLPGESHGGRSLVGYSP